MSSSWKGGINLPDGIRHFHTLKMKRIHRNLSTNGLVQTVISLQSTSNTALLRKEAALTRVALFSFCLAFNEQSLFIAENCSQWKLLVQGSTPIIVFCVCLFVLQINFVFLFNIVRILMTKLRASTTSETIQYRWVDAVHEYSDAVWH